MGDRHAFRRKAQCLGERPQEELNPALCAAACCGRIGAPVGRATPRKESNLAITVLMPRMGYDMQEARVVQWLKAEGDHVNMGEDIAEIETDKAIVPMPSVGTGTLLRQMAAEGDVVPVGQVLAVIGQPGEEIPPEMLVKAAPMPRRARRLSPEQAAQPAAQAVRDWRFDRLSANRCGGANGCGRWCAGVADCAEARRRAWHRPGARDGHGAGRSDHRSRRGGLSGISVVGGG